MNLKHAIQNTKFHIEKIIFDFYHLNLVCVNLLDALHFIRIVYGFVSKSKSSKS